MFIPGYSSAVRSATINNNTHADHSAEDANVDVIPGARGGSSARSRSSSSNAKRQQHQESETPQRQRRRRRRQSLPARYGDGEETRVKMDLILQPLRIATSKPARKTYLNTLLFLISSTVLLVLATGAYAAFYYNYVPQIGTERVIHLQYGDGPHPHGIASLDSELISRQAYDISITLRVPRSPPNLDTGNFMLSLNLLSQSYNPSLSPTAPPPSSTNPPPTHPISASSLSIPPETVLHTSRRPTILPYTSPLISLARRILYLPLYVLNLRQESEYLTIPMAERLSFPGRGATLVPGYAMLEVQAGQNIQVYSAKINFTARFSGLRWLMYNHRIASLIIFTSAFWIVEVIFALLGWIGFQMLLSSESTSIKQEPLRKEDEDEDTETIKTEPQTEDDPDLSDTPRSFPTYGRQPPLRYEPRIKNEHEQQADTAQAATMIQSLDADDEDEHILGGMRGRTRAGDGDSGLGTSYSEGGERSGAARRRSGV